MKSKTLKSLFSPVRVLVAVLLISGVTSAQSNKVKGVINGRSSATMTVQTQDSEKVTVVLTSATQVEEPEGAFRKKHLAMTALVPGLSVEVKGT
jgi:OOP family OmpA-OmpF porin